MLAKCLQPIYTHVILEVVNAPQHIRTIELEQRYSCSGFKFCKVATVREKSGKIILKPEKIFYWFRKILCHPDFWWFMPEKLSCRNSENCFTVKRSGIFFLFWCVATLFCPKWILLDHRWLKTRGLWGEIAIVNIVLHSLSTCRHTRSFPKLRNQMLKNVKSFWTFMPELKCSWINWILTS